MWAHCGGGTSSGRARFFHGNLTEDPQGTVQGWMFKRQEGVSLPFKASQCHYCTTDTPSPLTVLSVPAGPPYSQLSINSTFCIMNNTPRQSGAAF